jgi:O-antigen/teichoic acid export membrane protein
MRIVGRIKSQINKLMPRASFARNVGILAGGTALAQALTVLALPVITRLYTPEDFSVLAVYAALLGMIGVMACLRFEIAIPLPSDDFEAANLMVLGLFFTTLISGLVFLLVALVPEQIANGLGQPALQAYLWLLPVGVWLTGAFGCVQYWATHRKQFSDIAQTRMTQSVGSVLVQVLMGWLTKTGPLGLLLGQVTSSGAGFIKLGKVAWGDMQAHKQNITRETLKNSFRKNSQFPKFSTFESLANVGTVQIPIIIIAATAIGPEAGFALLAMKAAAVPMGLIGGSIAQVYLSRASNELRAGKLPEFTRKIAVGLLEAGVGPLICIGILAPDLLPLVFGVQWARAGEIVSWMTPWFILQFLASPLSMALHVTGNQKLAMLNQGWGLILRVGMTAWAAIYLNEYIVEIYSISGLLFYLGYFLIVLRVSGLTFLDVTRSSEVQIKIIVLWVVIACLIKASIDLLSI